jgi:hypothetical protein
VEASKDSFGNITEASFHINQGQTIFWTAAYIGTAKQFWLSTTGSNMADIALTSVGGQTGGSKFLSTGTYYVSIRTQLMGPGFYTVKFDPTGDGHNNGEPHITTVNGVHYDFQSAGEFVALRGESGMEIQTRQTPLSTVPPTMDLHSGLVSGVAFNSAVAARVNGHRVTFQMGPQMSNAGVNPMQLRVDGKIASLPPGGRGLGAGGRVMPSALEGIRIDFPDRSVLVVTPHWWEPGRTWYLDLDVLRTAAHEGIMGSVEGRNWLPALPGGVQLGPRPNALPRRYVDLYERFAGAWRVTDKTSLFDYPEGGSTADYRLAGWPRRRPPFMVPGIPLVKPLGIAAAARACRQIAPGNLRRDCIFDVRVTGDRAFADGYAQLQRVRLGTTATELVQADKGRGFIATVVSLAPGRGTPTGMVRLTLDGAEIGAAVRLDRAGRAELPMPDEAGEHRIAARYLPYGDLYLASESLSVAHR